MNRTFESYVSVQKKISNLKVLGIFINRILYAKLFEKCGFEMTPQNISITTQDFEMFILRENGGTDNGYMTPNLTLNVVDLLCKMGTRQFNEWFLSNDNR